MPEPLCSFEIRCFMIYFDNTMVVRERQERFFVFSPFSANIYMSCLFCKNFNNFLTQPSFILIFIPLFFDDTDAPRFHFQKFTRLYRLFRGSFSAFPGTLSHTISLRRQKQLSFSAFPGSFLFRVFDSFYYTYIPESL